MQIPLRLRLTLVFAVAMAVVLAGLGTSVYLRLRADLLDAVDMGLRSRAEVLAGAGGASQRSALVRERGSLLDADEAFAQVLDPSGRVLDASFHVGQRPLIGPAVLRAVSRPTFLTRRVPVADDPVRLLVVPAGTGRASALVVVGATLGDVDEAVGRLLGVLAWVGPAGLLLTATSGWLLAGAALRPVERLRSQAAAISASEPGRRLATPSTGDELERLASTLNTMLDRLEDALAREHRFVDDASHELRTPLATLRAEIDLALLRQRTAPELAVSLRSAQEDVQRLQRLADDLLVLARSRGGPVPVRRVPTSLPELIDGSVRSVAVSARAAGVTIEVRASEAVIDVDPDRLDQALRNLLVNAIRVTPPGGTVLVSARRDDGAVQLVVTDAGPGFPAALLSDAFEPFVRGGGAALGPDGSGLGLAIVRAVAEAHGGSVRAQNRDHGAAVTITLPTGAAGTRE